MTSTYSQPYTLYQLIIFPYNVLYIELTRYGILILYNTLPCVQKLVSAAVKDQLQVSGTKMNSTATRLLAEVRYHMTYRIYYIVMVAIDGSDSLRFRVETVLLERPCLGLSFSYLHFFLPVSLTLLGYNSTTRTWYFNFWACYVVWRRLL